MLKERCVACRRDSPEVTEQEVEELRLEVPEWRLTNLDGVKRIERSFKFRNFAEALNFATLLGEVSESEGHHPRLTVEWGKVGVEWWTHKINGLHRNDFIMAAKSDEIHKNASRTVG